MTTGKYIHQVTRNVIRIGMGLCLMALVWSCARVPGLREETSSTFIRVPFVRVLLDDSSDRFKIKADASFAIECLYEGQQVVFFSNRQVTIKNSQGRLAVLSHKGVPIEEALDEVNIIPRGRDNLISVDGRKYRGLVKALPTGQNVEIINVVYMEDYLRGVVPPEIGKRDEQEIEAVKAQAIAARTYAMAHLQQYSGEQYDMKSSIMDQVYDGVRVENKLINEAIDAISGRVIMYQDKFIQAYYHSTCGGMTEAINHVWDREGVAYLKPVADSGACSWSKYSSWRETFSERQLRDRIEQYLSGEKGRQIRIGAIQDVTVVERTPGGRVKKLLIRTENDQFKFYKDRIRWVIRRHSDPELILPSDRFNVDINRDPAGRIRSVTFSGRGYGHGVGMCQCGAIGLAREGWTYDNILKLYYTGVEITKLY